MTRTTGEVLMSLPAKFQGISIDNDGVNLVVFAPGSEHTHLLPLTVEDMGQIITGLTQFLTRRVVSRASTQAGHPMDPSNLRQ